MTARARGGPDVRDLMERLAAEPRFAPGIAAVRRQPARAARTVAWPAGLAPDLVRAAAALGAPRPYSHQAEAVEHALARRHVVVATGTASGKSLCFLLPVLDAALRDPGARALLLFPTKALAQDQLASLSAWAAALPEHHLPAATYDGDTPPAERSRVRRAARIVLTNPDMLHLGILPRHMQWAELFRGLTHVVLDEAHVYRGAFGSHVANVLRRLRRVAAFHGAAPGFVLTSATIHNPLQLARELTGAPARLVDDDGAPRGARTFVLYNPPVVDQRLGIRRGTLDEAAALARRFTAAGLPTILFARTRHSAELMVMALGQGPPGAAHDSEPPARGYRGGYTASERRATEADLRSGRLRCVVATSALELGVDIGHLDACVMAGYPGSVASTRQQAGRAGRRSGEAAAVLVAGPDPLDQFLARHPDYLLGASPERARLHPDNLLVLLEHVRCAAAELPFGDVEAALPFGAAAGPPPGAAGTGPGAVAVADLLAALQAGGDVRHVAGTWYWVGPADPAAAVGLRSSGADTVTIVREGGHDGPEADVLGTVERATAAAAVHPEAVYLHDGRAYDVASLDWDGGRAVVRPADGATYTRASRRTDLRPLVVAATRQAPGAGLAHGELEVRTRVTGYRRVRFATRETVAWGDVDLPEHVLHTAGYWFTLDDDTVTALERLGRWQPDPGGDRGPSWPEQRRRALARDGHRCRLCNAPPRPGRSHDVHHIRPFRAFGWVAGANRHDLAANDLDNLVTLCGGCHRAAERALGLHGGLSGLGYAVRHIAPLFLMCDARDIEVAAEARAPWTGRPTVAVYERAAGGLGYGATLFQVHEQLLGACAEAVQACGCDHGCPSCVGPVDDGDPEAKERALTVLAELGAAGAR